MAPPPEMRWTQYWMLQMLMREGSVRPHWTHCRLCPRAFLHVLHGVGASPWRCKRWGG